MAVGLAPSIAAWLRRAAADDRLAVRGSVVLAALSDRARGIAGYDGEGRDIFCDHRTCSHNRTQSYGLASRHDERVSADPDVIPNRQRMIANRIDRVVNDQPRCRVEEERVLRETVGRVIASEDQKAKSSSERRRWATISMTSPSTIATRMLKAKNKALS